MKKSILLFAGLAFLTFKNQAQTVIDYDGNVYDTIHIGTQVWLKENLKVKHYCNGDSIPNVTDNTQWINLTNGAYCNYANVDSNAAIYGRMYNFYTIVDSRNLCPTGWHVPSQGEWFTLFNYLGGSDSAGAEMKETGTAHWNYPNVGATNSTGFTLLPSGRRYTVDGSFIDIGWVSHLWTTDEYTDTGAIAISIANDQINLSPYWDKKTLGVSVRCLKGAATYIKENNYNQNFKLYPNPAVDIAIIDCAKENNVKMQIYNIVGKCLMQSELNNGTNNIDVSSLSKGIYIIKLTGSNWTGQQKLIIE